MNSKNDVDSLGLCQSPVMQITSESEISNDKSENDIPEGQTLNINTLTNHHNANKDNVHEALSNCTRINHNSAMCIGDGVKVSKSGSLNGEELNASENASKFPSVKVEQPSELTSEPSEAVTGSDRNNFVFKVKTEDTAMLYGTSEDSVTDTETGKETEAGGDGQVNLDVRNLLSCKLEVEDTVLNYDLSEDDDSSDTETVKETEEVNINKEMMNAEVKNQLLCMLKEQETVLNYSLSQTCCTDTDAMKKLLQTKRKMTATSLGFPVYVCPYEGCEKEFNRPWRLAEHEHTHTGKRPFVCSVEGCGRTYLRKQHLQRHTTTAHQETKSQEYFKCDVCNKLMKNRYSFAKHWYRAHVRQNYKCDECGQVFPKQQQLKSHSFVHTGIEPYMCEYPGCGARFMLPSRLRRHASVHVQNRYACPHESCGETFNVYHDLRKHLATSHPKVCEVCGKEFKQLRQLKVHRETHKKVHKALLSSVREYERLAMPTVSSPSENLPRINNKPDSATTQDTENQNSEVVKNIKVESPDGKLLKRQSVYPRQNK
ncbi:uncharacterized protein [Macrobrachium rosenbergii]|uniref:uncharacterized protein isoform X1 n=1 Tax=Macrobrachium rosenbergii TaxID=79674 RepID=UPI0034D72305